MDRVEEREVRMYGMTEREVIHEPLIRINSVLTYAMGLLSDAQEVMGSHPELARQVMNKAKFWMHRLAQYLGEGGEVTHDVRFPVTIEDLDEWFGW